MLGCRGLLSDTYIIIVTLSQKWTFTLSYFVIGAHPFTLISQSYITTPILRNWTFTLFYVVSELWGDVVLSLLFWGLANDITSLRKARVLYPLFGIGANVAQVAAGRFLKASL